METRSVQRKGGPAGGAGDADSDDLFDHRLIFFYLMWLHIFCAGEATDLLLECFSFNAKGKLGPSLPKTLEQFPEYLCKHLDSPSALSTPGTDGNSTVMGTYVDWTEGIFWFVCYSSIRMCDWIFFIDVSSETHEPINTDKKSSWNISLHFSLWCNVCGWNLFLPSSLVLLPFCSTICFLLSPSSGSNAPSNPALLGRERITVLQPCWLV